MFKSNIFKLSFYYSNERVNRFIEIIQTTDDECRIRAFKILVFKMMKDIVSKNIVNYLNLITNTNLEENPPTQDELLSDCYLIFDNCIEGFKLGFNFYFYYNKSLSRNFFRNYQRLIRKKNTMFELTDSIQVINENMHTTKNHLSVEYLMDTLNFTDLEKRICNSRLNGEKSVEFIEKNDDISSNEYSRALKSIKRKIKKNKIM